MIERQNAILQREHSRLLSPTIPTDGGKLFFVLLWSYECCSRGLVCHRRKWSTGLEEHLLQTVTIRWLQLYPAWSKFLTGQKITGRHMKKNLSHMKDLTVAYENASLKLFLRNVTHILNYYFLKSNYACVSKWRFTCQYSLMIIGVCRYTVFSRG